MRLRFFLPFLLGRRGHFLAAGGKMLQIPRGITSNNNPSGEMPQITRGIYCRSNPSGKTLEIPLQSSDKQNPSGKQH